jgi:hypothetical protein
VNICKKHGGFLKHFILLAAVTIFSVISFAGQSSEELTLVDQPFEKSAFTPVIEQSITQQNLTAEELHNSIVTASNEDDEHTPTDNYKAVPAAPEAVAAPEDSHGHAIPQPDPKVEAEKKAKEAQVVEKDFGLKLHLTGRASAQRYFPPKPKVAKSKKLKSSKASKLVKNNPTKKAKKSSKLAKNSKFKKTKTSSNKVAEDKTVTN